MDRASRTAWPTDVATAAATGVVTALFPLHRASTRVQWLTHVGLGVLAAGATAAGVTIQERASDERSSVAVVAAIAVGIGVVTVASSRGGQEADAWVERALARHGVRRPRAWIGAAAAGLSLGATALERRRAARPAPALDASPAAG